MIKRNTPNLRLVSWFLTFTMIMPLVATVSQAAVVNFLSPLPGQTSTGRYVEVAVSFNTQSDLAITRLELWIDGKQYSKKNLTKPESRGVCSFQWDTAGYVNGSHFLLVKMFAGNREIASISGAGTVGASNSDVIPPLVKISNIKSGAKMSGTQTIKLTALDNSGQYPLVSLLVDQKLKLLKNTAPYVYDLDTTAYDDGKHEIQTYAFDAEGNKSDVVTLDVVFANGKVVSANVEAPAAVVEKPAAVAKVVVPNEVATTNDTASRVAVSSPTQSMSSEKASVAATAPGKVIKIEAQPVNPTPVPVAKVSEPAPVPDVKPAVVAVAPKVQDTAVAEVVEKVEPVVVAQSAPAKPTISEPVVIAKLEPVSMPKARISMATKSITAVKSPLKLRTERPMVLASAKIEAPAVPAYVKPAPVKVAKAVQPKTVQTVVKPVVAIKQAPKVAVAPVVKPVEKIAPKVVAVPTVTRANVAKVKINQKLAAQKMIKADKPLKVVESAAPAPKLEKIQISKPVKMAMAPKIVKPSLDEVSVKPAKASYDVRAELPKTGKMKLRDLVKTMNGVVLWDSDTRTVTAYVKNMKLELRIGQNTVKVNGKKMKVNLVPYIAKGRTVIDVRLYDKACALASKKQPVASKK